MTRRNKQYRVVVNKKTTTIQIEPCFWAGLLQICEREDCTRTKLFSYIYDIKDPFPSLTSSARCFCLAYWRKIALQDAKSFRREGALDERLKLGLTPIGKTGEPPEAPAAPFEAVRDAILQDLRESTLNLTEIAKKHGVHASNIAYHFPAPFKNRGRVARNKGSADESD